MPPSTATRPNESAERVIPALPEDVFAVLADPRRHAEFDGSGTVRSAISGPDRLGPGARFGLRMHLGAPYAMTSTVVEYEENRRIAWQPRAPFLAGLVVGGRIWRYELEPVDGGTLVRETWDPSGERFPVLIEPYRAKARASLPETLERLERVVCAGAATR